METSLLGNHALDALAQIIEQHWLSASSNLKALKKGGESDSLHSFRVSIRRLQVWVNVCQERDLVQVGRKLRKRLKHLVKITNSARDAETHLAIYRQLLSSEERDERDGPHRIQKRWEDEIIADYKEILKVVPPIFEKMEPGIKKVLNRLAKASKNEDTKVVFKDWIRSVWVEYGARLDSALKCIATIDNHADMHKARILGKKLRYLLEPCSDAVVGISTLLRDLRQLQDLTGGLRDAAMLEGKLRKKNDLESLVKRTRGEMLYIYNELHQRFLSSPAPNFELRVENLC